MFKIEVAYGCNLKCPYCVIQKAKQQMPSQKYIKPEEFKKLNDKLGRKAVRMSFYLWGEPLVNPHIAKIVEIAAKSKVFTYFSSNFTLSTPEKTRALVDAGLGGISIPLDGWTKEEYEKYRVGGDVADVKAGLIDILDYRDSQKKRYPKVNLAVIRFDHIKDNMDSIREFANGLNIDAYTEKPNLENVLVYSKAIPYSKCFWPWYTMYIDTDGSAYPCVGYQREPAGKAKRWDFGNIYTDPLEDIWHGPNLVRMREFLTAKDKSGYTEEDVPCIRCPRYC